MGALIDLFLHLDTHLAQFVATYGGWVYAILFLIVFAETGLVVTPFLPGDSLLFAAGALAAAGGLNVWLVIAILCVAAIVGDAVNYAARACSPRRIEPAGSIGCSIASTSSGPTPFSRNTGARRSCSGASSPSCGRSSRSWPALAQ